MDFNLSHTIEILSQTPKTINSFVGGISVEWIETSDEEKWSVFDIIGHYIHGEETDWIPRAKIILAQGEVVEFESFDRFAQFENSKGRSLRDLLKTFGELRAKNLGTLRSWNLTDEQLGLKGSHPELGDVTLKQLLATWAVHDLNHIKQIATVIAKNYSDNVGPWKAYLSILSE